MKVRGNRLLKLLDKQIGIPLVYLLGKLNKVRAIFNRNIKNSSCVKRIALIKTAALGDTILLSAIVNDIKRDCPTCEIVFICTKGNYVAATLIEGLNEIVILPITKPWEAIFKLVNLGRFDIVFDFASWNKINAVFSFVLRSRLKVGFSRQKMYRHYVYDITIEHSDNFHELENYRNLIKSVGLRTSEKPPAVYVETIQNNLAPKSIGARSIVFHPFPGGAKSYLREWIMERWIDLGREMARKGYAVIISGGKDDQERAEKLASQIGENCISIAGRKSFAETGSIIKEAGLLVSVNTGTMHLGDAVGAKVVSLNGPTNVSRWGPVCCGQYAIVSKLLCAPCLSLGFEYNCHSGGCMTTITVSDVLKVIEKIEVDLRRAK